MSQPASNRHPSPPGLPPNYTAARGHMKRILVRKINQRPSKCLSIATQSILLIMTISALHAVSSTEGLQQHVLQP